MEEEDDSDTLVGLSGLSPLPKLRTPKRKNRVSPDGKICSSISCTTSNSKDVLDRLHTLSLGVTIGVISTILSNRREVEKLSKKLLSKESLIQDLQEELEMKDSLTVKELANDPCGSKKLKYDNYQTKEKSESSQSVLSDRYIPPEQTDDHKSSAPLIDTMSEMEELLEAELELLDININTSGLDGEIPSEVDPDLIVEFAHGELRADMLPGGNYSLNANDDSENISTSPNAFCNPNHAVSPRELSLRLHQVIQQRLEERVRELEQVLQQSQKRLEAKQDLPRRVLSSSDIESPPNQESSIALSEDVSTKPFYLNLTDDSLNAYDEAPEEFTRIKNVEKFSSYKISSKFGDGMNYSVRNLISGMEGNRDSKESELEALPSGGLFDFEEYQVISDSEFDEGIDRIDDDDECKMLIDQI